MVRYLDLGKQHDETIVLVSYPRSGSTKLRTLLEKIMGMVQGSDADLSKKLNKELQ